MWLAHVALRLRTSLLDSPSRIKEREDAVHRAPILRRRRSVDQVAFRHDRPRTSIPTRRDHRQYSENIKMRVRQLFQEMLTRQRRVLHLFLLRLANKLVAAVETGRGFM